MRTPIYRVLTVMAAAAVAVGACSTEKDTKTTTESTTPGASTTAAASSQSKNKDNPPQADVTVTSCVVEPVLGFPKAAGTITNHTAKKSNYIVHIAFLNGTTRAAEGYAAQNEVLPGQTANFEALGSAKAAAGVTCQVTSAERYASP